MGRRRRKKTSGSNHERWLVSYADFITLLFAFFTSMYAMSSVNEGKFKSFSDALQMAFNSSLNNSITALITPVVAGDGRRNLSRGFQERFSGRYRTLMGSMKGKPEMEGIRLLMEKDRIIIRVPGGTLFRSGSATLMPRSGAFLSELASTLKGLHSHIQIQGHTDNVPTSNKSFKSNWDLSSARALSVLKFFVNRHNIDPTLISATGYGEYRPLGSNDTPDGRRNNRRLDIVVLP